MASRKKRAPAARAGQKMFWLDDWLFLFVADDGRLCLGSVGEDEPPTPIDKGGLLLWLASVTNEADAMRTIERVGENITMKDAASALRALWEKTR